MSRKTEATSNSSNAAAATAAAASAYDAKKQLHSQTNGHSTATNGHSTAHDLDNSNNNNKDAMLTHKKRGDALLRDDEREELMLADRNKSSSDNDEEDKSKDSNEVSSGSLSGADTWNFALLVILCTFCCRSCKTLSSLSGLNPPQIHICQRFASASFLYCRTLPVFSIPTHKNTSLIVICALVVAFVVVLCCRGNCTAKSKSTTISPTPLHPFVSLCSLFFCSLIPAGPPQPPSISATSPAV
jgi:hypothetical protein